MSEQHDHHKAVQKVRELIKDVKFAMFTTQTDEGELHSRPMATQQVEFDGELWFLTSRESHKAEEVQHHPRVNVAYSAPDENKFVSVAGRADIFRDQAKIDELWSPAYKAWFPEGKEDPQIALIRVHVESAEYWHAPEGKMVHILGFAKAALTGKPYRPGEHASVDIEKDPAA